MKPINFKEQNRVLTKPSNMTDEECSSLHIFTDHNQCISCWEGTLKDRLLFLVTGKIWLGIISGETQPPVYLLVSEPFEEASYNVKKEGSWIGRRYFVLKEKLSYYTGW